MSEAVTTLKKNERLSLQMCLMSGNATLAILLELDLKVTSITCLANRLFLLFVFEEKKKKSKFPRILFEHFWKGICPRFCKLLTFYLAMPYKHIKGYFVVAYLGF